MGISYFSVVSLRAPFDKMLSFLCFKSRRQSSKVYYIKPLDVVLKTKNVWVWYMHIICFYNPSQIYFGESQMGRTQEKYVSGHFPWKILLPQNRVKTLPLNVSLPEGLRRHVRGPKSFMPGSFLRFPESDSAFY